MVARGRSLTHGDGDVRSCARGGSKNPQTGRRYETSRRVVSASGSPSAPTGGVERGQRSHLRPGVVPVSFPVCVAGQNILRRTFFLDRAGSPPCGVGRHPCGVRERQRARWEESWTDPWIDVDDMPSELEEPLVIEAIEEGTEHRSVLAGSSILTPHPPSGGDRRGRSGGPREAGARSGRSELHRLVRPTGGHQRPQGHRRAW